MKFCEMLCRLFASRAEEHAETTKFIEFFSGSQPRNLRILNRPHPLDSIRESQENSYEQYATIKRTEERTFRLPKI